MNGQRRIVSGGVSAGRRDAPLDPFGDIAAPPLRFGGKSELHAGGGAETGASRATDAQPVVLMLRNPVAHRDASGARVDGADDPASGAERTEDATATSDTDLSRRDPTGASPEPEPERTGLRQLRWAVTLGLVLAAGLVALALFFRPAPGETATRNVPTAIGSGPSPAPRTEDGAATAVGVAAVRLYLGPEVPTAKAQALRAAVEAAGYGRVEIHPATSPIGPPRIDYSDSADRTAAEALARALAPVADGLLPLNDAVGMGAEAKRIDVWVID